MNIQEYDSCGTSNRQGSPFYGKYRGVVTDNKDPWKIGRLQAKVRDVYGEQKSSGWALPSVPYAGKGVGLFLIPPVGALVWIEFENGDPDYPIWTGCFWADEKKPEILPAQPADPEIKVLKTDIGTIQINDTRGQESITIAAKIGGQTMQLVINASEIKIINGLASDVGAAAIKVKNTPAIEMSTGRGASVNLNGMKVSINDNALEVM